MESKEIASSDSWANAKTHLHRFDKNLEAEEEEKHENKIEIFHLYSTQL